jgi:hypothetical protein
LEKNYYRNDEQRHEDAAYNAEEQEQTESVHAGTIGRSRLFAYGVKIQTDALPT